ncbi:hypothetical protein J6X15_00625 [Candidatus Saccharibacteria bacterium]|nr:hypothetical protein [Candidatus Saccharibacteria bacterium]
MGIEDIKKYLLESDAASEDFVNYICREMAEYQDVVDDFCAWIKDGNFDFEPHANIEGWTARKLHEEFPDLPIPTIFTTLLGLYTDPKETKRAIETGFAIR